MKAFKHISDNCLKRYKRFPFAFKREREAVNETQTLARTQRVGVPRGNLRKPLDDELETIIEDFRGGRIPWAVLVLFELRQALSIVSKISVDGVDRVCVSYNLAPNDLPIRVHVRLVNEEFTEHLFPIRVNLSGPCDFVLLDHVVRVNFGRVVLDWDRIANIHPTTNNPSKQSDVRLLRMYLTVEAGLFATNDQSIDPSIIITVMDRCDTTGQRHRHYVN